VGSIPTAGTNPYAVLRDSNSSLAFTTVPYLCHVFDRNGTNGTQAFRVRREVIGREVRITAHHLWTLPTAQLLQREQRRSFLYVPRRPAVPQIMPAKILDAGALARDTRLWC
jgi:hypothetical protein